MDKQQIHIAVKRLGRLLLVHEFPGLVSVVVASRSENNVLCLPASPGKWKDDAMPPSRMGLSGGSTQCLETGGGICCYICSN
jgi:hypothetical protein